MSVRRFRWCGSGDADLGAGGDAVAGEPALICLDGVEVVLVGRMERRLVERLHVLDLDDRAFVLDEGDGERDEGVSHVEGVLAFLLEDEEHALVLRHALAVHESNRALFGGVCGLDEQVDLTAVIVNEGESSEPVAVLVGGHGRGC
jgi:hypothetical protein